MAKIPGPPNPVVATTSGYEHRAMPAADWARGAHLDADVSALAWCLTSEAPSVRAYPQYAFEIGLCVMNECRAEDLTAHERITMEGIPIVSRDAAGKRIIRYAEKAGHYGRQSGRWCASLQWPTVEHLAIARKVVTVEPDRSGPRRWADLRVMDGGTQGGKRLIVDGLALVRRRWDQGWVWIGELDEIDPYVLCLMRQRRRGDTLEPALAMVAAGRKKWRYKAPKPTGVV